MAKLDDKKVRIRAKKVPENGVIVKGIENCLVRISRCCNPVPGDEIIGYITRGRGVSVHRKDCINIMNNIDGDNRLIEVAWYTANNVAYKADITIMAHPIIYYICYSSTKSYFVYYRTLYLFFQAHPTTRSEFFHFENQYRKFLHHTQILFHYSFFFSRYR